MAQAALRGRDASLVDLKEAIRQAQRYIQSVNPSVRLINKKVTKVEEACDTYKAAQYAYCIAANIDLDTDDQERNTFYGEVDGATDCCDAGMLLVEQLEEQEATALQGDQSAAQATQAEAAKKTKIAQLKTLMNSDTAFSNEIVLKSKAITDDQNAPSEANAALLKSYEETLQHVLENLNNTWKDLISTVPSADLDALTQELNITETKVSIQEAISTSASFIEKSKPKAPPPQPPAPTPQPSTTAHAESKALRTQKASYPTFSGDVRAFARFQKEFQTIVVPAYSDPSHQAYVLKSECLKDSVKKCVENLDDVAEIWKRLEEKFGNKHDLVDVVVKDLGKVPKLKQNDDTKFISLVDMIEKGLQDLGAINARHELANSYTVTRVEAKLSRETYHEWLKEEEKMDGGSRFEKLFSFLKEERRRVEKIVQRNPQGTGNESNNKVLKPPWKNKELCNFAGGGSSNGDSETLNHCLIHPNAKHFTRKCRAFLALKEEERVDLVKSTNACPLCLSIKHFGSTCPFKDQWGPCNIDGCALFHARALHKAIVVKKIGTELCAAVSIGIEFNTLLLVQEIKSTHGDIKSMFDNGSTISLVSRSFVVRHRMKGIRVAFELVTVGGAITTQFSYLHVISLIDAEGNEHIIKAYQIDEICGEMRGTNLIEAASLFNGLSPTDVQRKNGHIELLIGAKHLSIHPDKIQSVIWYSTKASLVHNASLQEHTHVSADKVTPSTQQFSKLLMLK